MSLNYSKPIIKFRFNKALKVFSILNPNIFLLLFFIVAVILSFTQIKSPLFYIVFGIFVIGYFVERKSLLAGKK